MLRRRLLVSAAALASALALAACSGGATAPTQTPEQALAAAKEKFVAAKFVAISLVGKEIPAGRNGVAEATGTGEISGTEPKFQGTVQGTVNGVSANIEMVAVGDKAWWKLFTPDFTPADLTGLGAPNPASFFDTSAGLAGLLTATTGLAAGSDSRDGKDVVHTYTGKLPGSLIQSLFGLGDGTGTFDVTYGLTDKGEFRRSVMTGPFYVGSTSTYTLKLTDYGKAVTISAPQ